MFLQSVYSLLMPVYDFNILPLPLVRVFTALHVMQTRCSDENSARLSVCLSSCLSVCHTLVLWLYGRKICPDFFIPHER